MAEARPLDIPVILGTTRQGRASAHAARLLVDLLNRRRGVASRLIDIAAVPLPVDDAGESIKDAAFAAAMQAADGLVIVAPEYNHSFPGLLKHVLDSCLGEYIHKAVGLVGVSSGPFAGIRVVQGLLPVMRELGLVTIFWDINIGQVGKVFAEDGRLLDEAFVRRSDRFIRELLWMAKVLKVGREQVSIDDEAAEAAPPMPCPECGTPMTHHADKAVPAAGTDTEVTVAAAMACGGCGTGATALTTAPATDVPA
ncbi:MAG: NADPH-dependent FMN reductase [Vicinamibacterales bacterium]